MSTISNAVMTDVDTNLHKWLNELELKNDPSAKVVDLDIVSQWAGYGRKIEAKRAIQKYLKPDVDFCAALLKSTGGRPREQILLTIDAAKEFLFQAPTTQGKAVRHYFIECEKKWRLLKTNVDNGRVRLQDKVTGEVIDNPLKDGDYIEQRYDAAVANAQKNSTIARKFPDEGTPFYIEMNGLISESVLGKRPRQFLIENKLIKKQKNRKGNMVYPQHPNGRDVMTTPQLGVVTGLEAVAEAIVNKEKTTTEAMEKFKERQKLAMVVFQELHGQHLPQATLLEDVKEERRQLVAVE